MEVEGFLVRGGLELECCVMCGSVVQLSLLSSPLHPLSAAVRGRPPPRRLLTLLDHREKVDHIVPSALSNDSVAQCSSPLFGFRPLSSGLQAPVLAPQVD